MRLFNFKALAFGLVALVASAAVGYAVNITGTNSSMEFSIVKLGFERFSTTDNITAFAGGGQTSATLLDSAYNRVATVGTAADSVKLPFCQTGASNTGSMSTAAPSGNTTGMTLYVTNSAAANSMNVFPQLTQSINALAANTAFAMAAGKTAQFICSPAGGIWYVILGA